MLKIFNILIRLIAAVHLTVVVAFHIRAEIPADLADAMPLANRMGGKAKYLTMWANAIEALYFWIALLNDLISGCKDDKDQFLKRTRDFLFFSFVFPLTSLVSFLFWSLYAINRDLIFPKRVEQYIPAWFNHSLHTAIFVYAALELLTSYHKPSSKRSHLMALTAILLTYAVWYHIIFFQTGYWIYPILGRLSWFGRTALALISGLIGFGSLLLGLYGSNVVWRNRVQVDSRKSKKK